MDATERRDTHRVVVGADHTIRFVLKGQVFQGVPLANLSKGGCFVLLKQQVDGGILKGDLLENLSFEHRDFPHEPLTGRVAYALRGEHGEPLLEFTGLGVAFVTVPPEVQADLERFIALNLGI